MSLYPALDLTQPTIFTVLGTFLQGVSPAGTTVAVAQGNRIPEPKSPNYILMTPIFRTRLETNTDTYQDGFLVDPPGPSVKLALMPTEMTVQLDVHGPVSGDTAQVIATLWRDDYACDALSALNPLIQPLYAEEPRQMGFVNGENQWEERWSFDLKMQINPTVTVAQQFASTASVTGLIEADAL